MRQLPYDTGKVKIGLFYEPPRRNFMSRDAERLQRGLLRGTEPKRQPMTRDLLAMLAISCAISAALHFLLQP